ncbi:MAG: superoxide dismutase [Ni] [Planctomycetota bacterium]
MKSNIKRNLILVFCAIALAFVTPLVYSHCQMPCGIYDDPARLTAIAENCTTVEKAIKSIEELSAQAKPNMNQIVRWVNVKDKHAEDTEHIISYYFMAQRIKPVDKSDAGYEKYIKQLTLLHEMLVYSMKTKQTTDLANVEKLRSLLADFRNSYLGEQAHSH